MERMLDVIGRKRMFVSLPYGLAAFVGSIVQYVPGAPLTPDQVELFKTDNIVSENAASDGRTLQGLGITGQTLTAILPGYLVRFRKHGQFEARRGL